MLLLDVQTDNNHMIQDPSINLKPLNKAND